MRDPWDADQGPRGEVTGISLRLVLGLLLGLGVFTAVVVYVLWPYVSVGPARRVVQDVMAIERPSWMRARHSNGYLPDEPPRQAISTEVVRDPLQEQLAELRRRQAQMEAELKALRGQPASKPVVATNPPQPSGVKRPALGFISNERPATRDAGLNAHTLAVWTYIPCLLENVLVSELEGPFTVKTTRPVFDVTGQHVLIAQGARIGVKSETADLLLGNERIPGFSLSLQGTDGHPVDLGEAPILDASGTLGLTGKVDNHTWRLVWTSIFLRGLESGQQVLQTQMQGSAMGPVAGGLARGSSDAAQKRLGRAQDTRPTITAHAGELCHILTPKALRLPAIGAYAAR